MKDSKATRLSKSQRAEKLWQAMLVAYPLIAKNGTKHDPYFAARLALQSAESIVSVFETEGSR